MMDPEGRPTHAEKYSTLCHLIAGRMADAHYEEWSSQDWAELARLAEAEGVASLIYWAVSKGPAGILGIPADIRNWLSRRYYADAAQNALLFSELDKLLGAFSQAGVPVLILKGAALARAIYPDPALRPMNDLDLLVRLPDLRIAMRVVRQCGYRLMKSTYHIVFQGGKSKSVAIELHWDLIGSSVGQTEGYIERVWERAIPLGNGDALARQMHPMDCLLYLCAHLIWQHPQEHARLLWYYDLYLLIQHYGQGLDWEALADAALQAGWAGPLYQALVGVERRFGAQHPQGFLVALAGKAPESAEVSGVGSTRDLRLQRWLWMASNRLPWGLRLRVWLGFLLPDPAYMRWRYQPRAGWLLPAYYPLRWWLLLRDGLASRMK